MAEQDKAESTFGELVVSDLEQQLGAKSRELALTRVRYKQLAAFVEQNADKLGLTAESDTGQESEESGNVNGSFPADIPTVGKTFPVN